MTALKSLMAGGALIALMATPALSLDIGGSVSGGASGGGSTGGIATSVGLSASANAEGGNVANATGAFANAVDAAVSDAQALVGETIATADAAIAGTVRAVRAAPNGMIDVRLSVNGELGVDPRTVTLRMSADAAASGSITLPMTAAEFVSRLDASAG